MPDINGIPYVESSDLVSAYPAASQALAQEVSDQLALKVDYALPTNAQTGTTYTFVAADAEKLTTASNAAAVTLTIPPASSVAWPDNTVLRVVNYGAGAVTIDGGSGVTVTNTATTVAQYGAAVAIRTGSDAWTVVPFGGGDVPAATVSSPAATGQYSSGGFTWDYYTFTASGSITVDTAGFADLLLIGGGGSGSSGSNTTSASGGGGGGGGGFLAITDAYLPAGTHTVTVGGGGPFAKLQGGQGYDKRGGEGGVSALAGYAAAGGGGGSAYTEGGAIGGSGGGGAGTNINALYNAGVTSSPPGQGNSGGDGGTLSGQGGGGGGGAGAAGSNFSTTAGGNGGAGQASSITGTSVTYAGGGGGGGTTAGGTGGAGGGTAGTTGAAVVAGTANTGGGSGGSSNAGNMANGGSGIVVVRVKV